jgi:hypothetical protein
VNDPIITVDEAIKQIRDDTRVLGGLSYQDF